MARVNRAAALPDMLASFDARVDGVESWRRSGSFVHDGAPAARPSE